MRNTLFNESEFQAEKQVVEEELRIGLDGPWEALENEVWATAFRQHPYHWPTVGWLEDLEAASAADMKGYYDKWYHPRNATIVLVGDFQTERALARINELFDSIPAGPAESPLAIIEPAQRGEKRVLVRKETPVERLLIGYHVPPVGHEDVHALHVAEAILATGKSSRLYLRLVEGDKSVSVADAAYHDHIDPPLFYFQAEIKPGFPIENVEQAIYEEIDKLKRGEVSQAELDKAKRQIEADFVLNNEEALQQAILLGQYETIANSESIPERLRGFRYLDAVVEQTNRITVDDVARVAERYLVPDNRTVGFLRDAVK
jgi:zinc protease